MKKTLLLSLSALLCLTANAEKVELSTPHNTLVLDLWKGGEPKFVYYGEKLSTSDLASLPEPTNANWSHLEIYPAYGATHTQSETAFAMRHADGNLSTQLLVENWTKTSISDKAPNGANRTGERLTITLKDPLYPNIVHLYYQAYNDVDMIECWTDVTNSEKATVTLTQFYSSCLPSVAATSMHTTFTAHGQAKHNSPPSRSTTASSKSRTRTDCATPPPTAKR